MKKVVVSAAMGSLLFATVSADQTIVTAHEEPAVVVNHHPGDTGDTGSAGTVEDTSTCNCGPSLGGVSLMLGIGGSFLKNKWYKDADLKSKNANRVIGTVGFGFGKVFRNNFYAGAEILVDFTKSKKVDLEKRDGTKLDDSKTSYIKSSGILTSFGLRLGYVNPKWRTMFYTAFRASSASSKVMLFKKENGREVSVDVKNRKVVPEFALGIEKAFSKKFSGRLEGAYRLHSKKTFKFDDKEEYGSKANQGFTFRALASCNVGA